MHTEIYQRYLDFQRFLETHALDYLSINKNINKNKTQNQNNFNALIQSLSLTAAKLSVDQKVQYGNLYKQFIQNQFPYFAIPKPSVVMTQWGVEHLNPNNFTQQIPSNTPIHFQTEDGEFVFQTTEKITQYPLKIKDYKLEILSNTEVKYTLIFYLDWPDEDAQSWMSGLSGQNVDLKDLSIYIEGDDLKKGQFFSHFLMGQPISAKINNNKIQFPEFYFPGFQKSLYPESNTIQTNYLFDLKLLFEYFQCPESKYFIHFKNLPVQFKHLNHHQIGFECELIFKLSDALIYLNQPLNNNSNSTIQLHLNCVPAINQYPAQSRPVFIDANTQSIWHTVYPESENSLNQKAKESILCVKNAYFQNKKINFQMRPVFNSQYQQSTLEILIDFSDLDSNPNLNPNLNQSQIISIDTENYQLNCPKSILKNSEGTGNYFQKVKTLSNCSSVYFPNMAHDSAYQQFYHLLTLSNGFESKKIFDKWLNLFSDKAWVGLASKHHYLWGIIKNNIQDFNLSTSRKIYKGTVISGQKTEILIKEEGVKNYFIFIIFFKQFQSYLKSASPVNQFHDLVLTFENSNLIFNF